MFAVCVIVCAHNGSPESAAYKSTCIRRTCNYLVTKYMFVCIFFLARESGQVSAMKITTTFARQAREYLIGRYVYTYTQGNS